LLDLARSEAEIAEMQEKAVPGAHVILYMDDEFEVEGVLDFVERHKMWVASPIYSTLVDLDGGSAVGAPENSSE
jgi:hypothetical protein